MKTKIIFLSIVLVLLSSGAYAQKQDASAAVQAFYKFHFANENIFNEKAVGLRRRFLTPRLQRLFDAELRRQKIYLKKYPDNKPYFEGLSFEPIEFCENDYSVGETKGSGSKATVKVNFVYGKSSCEASDGTKIFYKISLLRIGGKWLIDNVIYDDGKTLVGAFNEAKNIK